MSYIVSENSVITSLYTPSNNSYLTCGGTNIAPKDDPVTTWANFTVGSSNFKYIFSCNNFNGGSTNPKVRGASSLSPDPTTIKQFLYNNGTIQYVCGQFSFTGTPTTANNIMYFDPNQDTQTTGDFTFNNLSGITFGGSSTDAINCMEFLNDSTEVAKVDTTKLVIAGTFSLATIGGISSFANIALLNFSNPSTWTINNSISTNTTINNSLTIINSIIVIGNIIYVGGVNSGNCIFYSYNTTSPAWTDLLAGATYTSGTINILKKTNNYIAIGGNFTSLGSVSDCNNIVLYTTSNGAWTSLGTGTTKGVTGVAASSPIYGLPQVFALEYLISSNILWVGGYFKNAGDTLANSIAFYNFENSTWGVIDRNGDNATPTTKGLLYFSSDDPEPGVVYALKISAVDTSVIMVGGSFRTSTTPIARILSQNIFNLVKITTAITTTSQTKRNYTRFNSKSQ
jgi:hypothetical protein